MAVWWLWAWQAGHLMKLFRSLSVTLKKTAIARQFLGRDRRCFDWFRLASLRDFFGTFSYAKECSRSFFCPRVRFNVAMSSAWTNFKASWESRSLFHSLTIVFCFSPWSLHHVLKSKLVIMEKNDVRTCRKPTSQAYWLLFIWHFFLNGANATSCVFEKNKPTGQTLFVNSLHCKEVKSV